MNKDGQDGGVIINGLDLQDIISYISTKNSRYVAITLQDIEELLGADHPEFGKIRKTILDGFNNYTRSLVRAIFGTDIE